MTDTPDEADSGNDRPSDETPEPADPRDGAEAPPKREEDARDVIGTALSALRTMIDPSSRPDAPNTGASD